MLRLTAHAFINFTCIYQPHSKAFHPESLALPKQIFPLKNINCETAYLGKQKHYLMPIYYDSYIHNVLDYAFW